MSLSEPVGLHINRRLGGCSEGFVQICAKSSGDMYGIAQKTTDLAFAHKGKKCIGIKSIEFFAYAPTDIGYMH